MEKDSKAEADNAELRKCELRQPIPAYIRQIPRVRRRATTTTEAWIDRMIELNLTRDYQMGQKHIRIPNRGRTKLTESNKVNNV